MQKKNSIYFKVLLKLTFLELFVGKILFRFSVEGVERFALLILQVVGRLELIHARKTQCEHLQEHIKKTRTLI